MAEKKPLPDNPYRRFYTRTRSFSELRPAPKEEPMENNEKKIDLPEEFFSAHLGMELTHKELGHVKGRIELKPWMKNPIGSVHGGVLFSLADTTSGAAVVTYGHSVTTVTGTIDYMAPALTSTTLLSEAVVLKHGRTISVVECTIHDETGKLLGKTHMTFYNLTVAMAAEGKVAPLPELEVAQDKPAE